MHIGSPNSHIAQRRHFELALPCAVVGVVIRVQGRWRETGSSRTGKEREWAGLVVAQSITESDRPQPTLSLLRMRGALQVRLKELFPKEQDRTPYSTILKISPFLSKLSMDSILIYPQATIHLVTEKPFFGLLNIVFKWRKSWTSRPFYVGPQSILS